MKRFPKIQTWETVTWTFLIVATLFSVAFFPWYVADVILKYIFGALGLAAIFWYMKSRQLYEESEEKTKQISADQKELRNRQKTIDLIYENSEDGIIVLDNEQRIISFSPGMEKITGYNKAEVLGRLAQQMLKFRADKENSLLPDMMFLPKDIKKRPYVRNVMTTKEGREIDIEASYSLIKSDKDGHKALAIIRDVTYENELVERDKEFIAITSHQMNTPLSIIRGYVSLMKNGKAGKVTTGQADYLDEIYNSVKKLIAITNNLLSISRIEQDKIKIEKTDVNVSDLFKKLKQNVSFSELPSTVKITFAEPDPKLLVFADEEKLSQALSNLIDNSIKYTKKGEISVSAGKKGDQVILEVSDSGIGIPETDMEKIGQKFFRSQNAIDIDHKGTGLGMFIVKTIAEKHGAILNIESKKDKGTKVTMALPEK